ncbi:MAG TPA: hypothetical protein PL037_03315, partial [Elusimicrobiales bacterium]|nr:hypothetical protein [Elusimicrobiales bacterium]
MEAFELVPPGITPPLDPGFRPPALANRAFRKGVASSGAGVPLAIGLERNNGEVSRYDTMVFPDGHPRAAANLFYAERLVKTLLWQRGAWKVFVGGPRSVGEHIRSVYSRSGARGFDNAFMGDDVYEKDFTVVPCAAGDVPPANERSRPLGGHLNGCRIGFDLGASDRKVSAVIDGRAVFSEEVIWEPRKHSDPEYHYREILAGLKAAAAKMPRVDAIGGSSAGIIVDNRPMVASLFRGVPKERYHHIRGIFLRIRDEMKVPLEVINDGDVTALAGAMSLEDGAVLGVALGSSEAGGYVNREGRINPWLNELAFMPVDYQPGAPVDEWSGDKGTGVLYFSQQCVFRLAPKAGVSLPSGVTDAEKLKAAQTALESGHEGAADIWRTIGCYLGYSVAHYADFYDAKHVLILGRCTSGRGGELILEEAGRVLRGEFPELAGVNI